MALTIDELTEQVLQLPAGSRAHLAEQIVESLARPDSGEVQKLWAAEAIRRRDAFRSGTVLPIPGEQVLAEIREAVSRP